jgi:hypothetical protein
MAFEKAARSNMKKYDPNRQSVSKRPLGILCFRGEARLGFPSFEVEFDRRSWTPLRPTTPTSPYPLS